MSLTPRIDRFENNLMINGGFDFWQRVALINITNATTANFVADRFRWLHTAASGILRAERRTDLLPNTLTQYNAMMQVATATPSYSGSEFTSMEYRMEGYDWEKIYDRSWTIQFLVRATKTGTMSFSARAVSSSYVVPVVITAANTWQAVTITIPAAPAGPHALTSGEGVRLNWTIGAGPNLQTSTTNAWFASGTIVAVTGQTNFMSTLNDDVRISQISIVPGDLGLDEWQRRGVSIAEELMLCQRYYEKSYNLDINPGTSTSFGRESYCTATAFHRHTVNFKVYKRATPTINIWSETGVVNNVSKDNGTLVGSLSPVIGTRGWTIQSGSHQAPAEYSFHWDADAEL